MGGGDGYRPHHEIRRVGADRWGLSGRRPGKTDSRPRPTAYGSTYGLRHPAAQEALRIAAIVTMDQLADLGPEELAESLPPDAGDLVDDELVVDFVDTLFLVGWKFGQPRPLMLSSLAEQIAGLMLIRHAEGSLEDREVLSPSGLEQARGELADLEHLALDVEFVYEYLPSVDAQNLGDVVPRGFPEAIRRAIVPEGAPTISEIGCTAMRWGAKSSPWRDS